jgi:hypothetical protein
MSKILGPDGLPITRERGAFGPASLDEFPEYTEPHWEGLQQAANALFEERYTVMMSTPMALLRADFISLAVNVKRLRERHDKMEAALRRISETSTDVMSSTIAAGALPGEASEQGTAPAE